MKSTFKVFALFTCLAILTVSCSKDEDKSADVNKMLEGTWNVTTWLYDGNEQLGGLLGSSFTMNFVNESETTGHTTWTTIISTGPNVQQYDYVLKDNGKKLELSGTLTLDVTFFNGGDLRLSGTVQGKSYVTESEKQ